LFEDFGKEKRERSDCASLTVSYFSPRGRDAHPLTHLLFYCVARKSRSPGSPAAGKTGKKRDWVIWIIWQLLVELVEKKEKKPSTSPPRPPQPVFVDHRE